MFRTISNGMELPLYNQKAEEIGNIELPDSVFGAESNDDLVYQVATSQMANKRQVFAHAKTRAEVRGGGKKPWRQKGTGRARHGSIRSPIWKGGGATFGPTKDVKFSKKINKKMVRKALTVVLSEKAKQGGIILVDNIILSGPKTKEAANIINSFQKKLGKTGSILFITPSINKDLYTATKNIQKAGVTEARNINPLEALSYKHLVLVKESINVLEKR